MKISECYNYTCGHGCGHGFKKQQANDVEN